MQAITASNAIVAPKASALTSRRSTKALASR